MRSRFAKRELLSQVLSRTGCQNLLRLAGTWQGLVVLNYHRIGSPEGSLYDWDLWSATEEQFDSQVRYLARHFDVIGLDDLDDVLQHRRGRAVMMTFDDGYRDNYERAFPILRAHHVPATFFITTGFLDQPRLPWWDEIAWMIRRSRRSGIPENVWTLAEIPFDEPNRRTAVYRALKTYKTLGQDETGPYLNFLADATGSGRACTSSTTDLWMTWDMVREMRHAGMSFGGHTVTHPILANISPELQDREIAGCRRRLEAELHEPIRAFSFPVGGPASFNEITRVCLRNHGFEWAFSYYGGYCRPPHFDPYDLPRIAVELGTTFQRFSSVLSLPQWFS